MRRKKLKPTLRSIYHSPKYQPKVVLTRLTLSTLLKYKLSKQKKDIKRSDAPVTKVLPLPPRRKISIDLVESRSVQENVVSSGSSIVEIPRPRRKASTASHSDDQEVSIVAVSNKMKNDRLKSRVLSSRRPSGDSQNIVYQVNVDESPRARPSCPPRVAVSSTSSAKKGNYEEDGFLNSADDTSSREGTPDASSARPWPTPKIVSVSSMAIPDSQAKLRVRKPLLSSQDEAASSSETTVELEERSSLQPTTTTSSPTKDTTTAEPPAKVMRLADDADEAVPEAEVPQPAQLGFWDRAKKAAAVQESLNRLQTVVAEVSRISEQRAAQMRVLEAKSNGIQHIICDPRCVELQRTLAALGIADEIFVKLAGIISDSQPGTEFYNPKAAIIMNLIKGYTSLY